MGRGLSGKQYEILWQIAKSEGRTYRQICAWRDIGVSYGDIDDDYFDDPATARRQDWNSEQSLRRALKSLQRRGLIGIARYVFMVMPDGYDLVHVCTNPENHVPGQTRIMTGAYLTDAGRAMIDAATAHVMQEMASHPPLPPELEELANR
jgi:hypothetical protein